MAKCNKTLYNILSSIKASQDDRGIIFHFENNTSFRWSVIDHRFYHENTNSEFAQIHFKNILWGMEVHPGREHFFTTLSNKANEGWTKNFFYILNKYVQDQILKTKKNKKYCKLEVRKICKLDTMLQKDVIWPIESLAKNNFIAQMNLDNLCKEVFKDGKVLSFKDMQQTGLDKWFFHNVGDRVHPKHLRDDANCYNAENDVYGEDENKMFILGNYLQDYQKSVEKEFGDVFRHTWEKYKFPLNGSGYYFTYFKQDFDYLVSLGYDRKRLIDYLFEDLSHQGLRVKAGDNCGHIGIMKDYARMSIEVLGKDFDRYPRYLKTAHDIVMQNYQVNKSKTLVEKYNKIVENLTKLEYKGEKYSVIAPKTVDEVVKEGQSLNHCVANYIEDFVNGQYAILFLRDNERIDHSLVTIQVIKGRVIQSRGVNNRFIEKEEKEFLNIYENKINKQKELIETE